MRAITGAVVSSKPYSLPKAVLILHHFYDSAADCATYLRTAPEATREHGLFRRGLRANQQQGAANLEAYDYEGERKHQDRERKGDTAVPAGGSHRDSAAEVELDAAASEKKSKKKKNKEDRQQVRAVAGVESHIPSSSEIGKEKRKEKISIKEIIAHVKQEPVDEELLSEKKSKKKKEKGRVKLEEEARDVNVKKRKKKKHVEEISSKDVKQEEKMASDGDLDSEKKRKKKRGRVDNDNHMLEQVEHTKKKQRK
ncbi:hypothetical protein PAHAL_6G210300 [Panicum hallii]|uniref:Uncharacterized protein n=1 Tax=Panicum hallii TaxID=206008 RepID=A0A2T8IH15_9POAL|nr:hypothetical protein PAHAL_6G210300 [Panicum hallii]